MAVGSMISPFAFLGIGEGIRSDMKNDISAAQGVSDLSLQNLRDFELTNPYASGIGGVSAVGDTTGQLSIDMTSDRIARDSQAQVQAQTLEALKNQGPGQSAIGLAQFLATQGEKSDQARMADISRQFQENRLQGIRGREAAAGRSMQAQQANLQRDLSVAGGTANIQAQQLQQAQGTAELDLAQLQGSQDALTQNTAMWAGIGTDILGLGVSALAAG